MDFLKKWPLPIVKLLTRNQTSQSTDLYGKKMCVTLAQLLRQKKAQKSTALEPSLFCSILQVTRI
jgi:hypothetical protein